MRFLRGLGITVLANVAAGVATGTGARLAMRVVALTDDDPGTTFTLGGTFGILFAVTLFSTPVALLFVALRRKILGSDLRKGLVLGAVVVLFPGLPFVLPEAAQIGHWWLNVPMFGGLLVGWGVLLSVAAGWLDRRLPGADQTGLAADQAASSRSGPNTALGM